MSTQKQHYIPVGKELIPVSEETYLYHSRWIANERYRARRDHRCGTDNYTKCTGDCGHCIHQLPGDVSHEQHYTGVTMPRTGFGYDIPD